jgi:hypothetical protein
VGETEISDHDAMVCDAVKNGRDHDAASVNDVHRKRHGAGTYTNEAATDNEERCSYSEDHNDVKGDLANNMDDVRAVTDTETDDAAQVKFDDMLLKRVARSR